MSSQISRRTWSLGYIHQKDFKDMINKKVWRKYKRGNMPPNRRLIDSKWVFKKKSGGQFRASIVARGHTQIPWVGFTYKYSPAVTDVTLYVILLMWLIKKWYYQTIGIETYLLYALLDEEIHTKIPEGMAEALEE